MNKYALLAQEHWQKHAPTRYATLDDPSTYFRELGESVAAQVAQIAERLERELPSGLPYLERVGQINAIRLQAEEIVLSELVYSVPPETSTLVEELEDLLGELPDPRDVEAAIQRIEDDAAETAELEGFSTPSLTSEQAAQKERLSALLPLLTLDREPDEMTEAQLRERIQALRPFSTQLPTL